MIRRTLLSSLVALLLVAAPAAALPSGLPLSPGGWLTIVWDGVLDLFVIEKARATNDPNGQANDDTERQIIPFSVAGPDLAVDPGTP